MHFRPFPVFLAYVFLSGKSADPNPPPLLVENSTNFFFETFPYAYGRAYLTVPVLLTKNLFDSTPAAFCGC